MIDIRPLEPRKWELSDPLMAYNNADGQVVAAHAMSRGNSSYYDRYGYQGSRDIVCADCKQGGRDLAVILVEPEKRRPHFRHRQGEAPDGLGRHGETAEHLRGKYLIGNWLKDQRSVLPWTVEEEFWRTGVRLRSDMTATVATGQSVAFEIQRIPLGREDWRRRHGGYKSAGILDAWLWSPEVPRVIVDLPLRSVVLDVERASLGVLVARYLDGYRHPTAEARMRPPTHFAAAPLGQWRLSATGALVPPAALHDYIGSKPDVERMAQLNERYAAPRTDVRPTPTKPFPRAGALPFDAKEEARRTEALARIFGRKR